MLSENGNDLSDVFEIIEYNNIKNVRKPDEENMKRDKLLNLLENEHLLQELIDSDELSDDEKKQIISHVQKLKEEKAKELSDSEKAANMLDQLEAEINPRTHTEAPSVNGVEILDEDGNVRVMKVGRNDPCPCGSGKKYKRCCGR